MTWARRYWSQTTIDLVILDFLLTDMEGSAVFPLIKEARPHAKFIVCTGYGPGGPAEEIMDKGALGYLQKSFTHDDLTAKIREII